MERISPILDALLPKTKQHLLSEVLLQPQRSWYLSELARRLHVPPSSLQRDLAQFAQAGIVTKRLDGNRVYFQANRTCPIFQDLSRMLAKTAGLADVVRFALAPFRSKIEIALIYGSVASSEEHSSSDVDLMIIGKANLADLAVVLRPLEEELGRSVNVSVYTTQEFRKRLNEKNHFLSSVLRTELLFVLGEPDDLARLVDRTARKGS
jgi:DNA-binding transcriptional ArsR family regulator